VSLDNKILKKKKKKLKQKNMESFGLVDAE